MSTESARSTAHESLTNIGTSLLSTESQISLVINGEKSAAGLTVMGISEMKEICTDLDKAVAGLPDTPVKPVRRLLDPGDEKSGRSDDLVEAAVQKALQQNQNKTNQELMKLLRKLQTVELAKSKHSADSITNVQEVLPAVKDEAVKLLAMIDTAAKGSPFACSMTEEHTDADVEYSKALNKLVDIHTMLHTMLQTLDARTITANAMCYNAASELNALSYDDGDENREGDE